MSNHYSDSKTIEIKSEEDIRRINYYNLCKVLSKYESGPNNSTYLYEIDVSRSNNRRGIYKFRFFDYKLMKYFISKLSKANFKKERMRIDDKKNKGEGY